MQRSLKICFAAAEVAPFAKTGGLADVAGALPEYLARLGHDVRVFVPLYSSIDRSKHEFNGVEFIRDICVEMGGRDYRFSAQTARLPNSELYVHFIDCPELYSRDRLYTDHPDEPQRFGLFARAVIESCQRMAWGPDIFHCNDWHTGLIPLFLRSAYEWDGLFKKSRSVATIHNIGYQGVFPADSIGALGLSDWTHLVDQEDLGAGRLNFLKTGLLYADAVTTVSPTYAREIQTDDFGMGLQRLLRARKATLLGILNGVNYEEWSPESDNYIPHRYSREDLTGKHKNKQHLLRELGLDHDPGAPLAGVVSRLIHQKGFDLFEEVLPAALSRTPLKLAALGTGETRYEELFQQLQQRFPRQVCYYRGYSEELAHLIEAGSDMFLMPSRYEPCGLNQMFSLRYGTIPVVRRTGGLADTVRQFDGRNGDGTGFVFEHYTAEGFGWALGRALATYGDTQAWTRLVHNAMAQDFSWEKQTLHYEKLYGRLVPA